MPSLGNGMMAEIRAHGRHDRPLIDVAHIEVLVLEGAVVAHLGELVDVLVDAHGEGEHVLQDAVPVHAQDARLAQIGLGERRAAL